MASPVFEWPDSVDFYAPGIETSIEKDLLINLLNQKFASDQHIYVEGIIEYSKETNLTKIHGRKVFSWD